MVPGVPPNNFLPLSCCLSDGDMRENYYHVLDALNQLLISLLLQQNVVPVTSDKQEAAPGLSRSAFGRNQFV